VTGAVLVTGALGHVGSTTVRELVADGTKVVATDVLTDANRKVVGKLPKRASTYWADLTDADAVERMVADIEPSAIVHLAAVIPPSCYCNPTLARKVNVEGTAALIAAAQRLSSRPRFVQASSVAVYGPRNPYLTSDLLGPETPFSPIDTYGQHKVEAESLVRSFALDWVILRLGAVLDTNLFALTTDADALLMEWALPADGRINTVDVRDVATGFRAAVTADVVGEVLMIGGDESHRLLQRDVGSVSSVRPGWPAPIRLAGPVIRSVLTHGSSVTGWTRRGRRRVLSFKTIRGPTCWRKYALRRVCGAFRYTCSHRC